MIEPTITANVWHEIMVWEYRDTVAGVGHLEAYWDGKKIADSLFQNPSNNSGLSGMGSNTAGDNRGLQCGLVYTQDAASYPLTMYLDGGGIIIVCNGKR